jgi:hypothetical protein
MYQITSLITRQVGGCTFAECSELGKAIGRLSQIIFIMAFSLYVFYLVKRQSDVVYALYMQVINVVAYTTLPSLQLVRNRCRNTTVDPLHPSRGENLRGCGSSGWVYTQHSVQDITA